MGVLAAWLLVRSGHSWTQLIGWSLKTQAKLHQGLTRSMRAVGDSGWAAVGPLVTLSFLYGIFHAAGPGHGKAVMSTYLGTSAVALRRGLILSTLAALLQGVVAIALVEVVVTLMGHSLRQANRAGNQLEQVSYVLVALLGAILVVRSGWALWRRWHHMRQHDHAHHHEHDHCAHCDALQELATAQQSAHGSWKTELLTVLSIGARPCTGAVLILIVAYSLGLRWAGIAGVMAMSAGTAITVELLAAGVVSFRRLLLRTPSLGAAGRAGAALQVLGVVGGVLIMVFGLSLLQASTTVVPHPLL